MVRWLERAYKLLAQKIAKRPWLVRLWPTRTVALILNEAFWSLTPEPVQDLESLCASSLPLQEVVTKLAEGNRIWTKCVVAVGPRPEKTGFLTCRVQDFICLEEVLQHKQPKRLSSELILIEINHSRSLMTLHEGDTDGAHGPVGPRAESVA